MTEYEEQCLVLTLQSYGNEITAEHAAIQENLIDTKFHSEFLEPSLRAEIHPSDLVQSDVVQSDAALSEDTSVYAAEYWIEELRLYCTLPSNWVTMIKDSEPEQEALALIGMNQKMLAEYFEHNQSYLLTFSDDNISEMTFAKYNGPSITRIFSSSNTSNDAFEKVSNLIKDYQVQYPGITFTGWDFYTLEGTSKYLVLQYWYDRNNQRVYCQQYIKTKKGQDLALTLRYYGSEITAESAAVQKEMADNLYVEEIFTFTPEETGAIAASITIDIVITCMIVSLILNKIQGRLKKKRGWAAALEESGIAFQYDQTECLKKANYELRIYSIMGFLYFISVYFCMISSVFHHSGYFIQMVGLSVYGFRELIKTRKESIRIIDHIFAEVYPEKKKRYHIFLTMLMLLFLFLLFWPLLIAACLLGFSAYYIFFVLG